MHCVCKFFLRPATSPRAGLVFLPILRDTASFDGVAIRRRRRRVQRAAPRFESRSVRGDTTDVPQSGPHTFFMVHFSVFRLMRRPKRLEASETGKQTARTRVTSGVMDLVETTKRRVYHEDMSPTSRDEPDA